MSPTSPIADLDAGKTDFPRAIALASSWDPELVREVHSAIAAELRARGARMARGPMLDVARDPRRGRIEQSFGEDPYLVGEMGVAAVEGLQGPGRAAVPAPGKVLAAAGHFAGHGLADGVGAAPVSERELREVFFPPFEQVLKRTGLGTVIASRNEIDGVPSHASKWLLRDVLRKEWGFAGTVLADRGGIEDLNGIYRVAAGPAEAALLARESGVDTDEAVARSFAPRSGAEPLASPPTDAAARELALKAAQRSIVLLKNDGVLPLARAAGSKPRIAVAVLNDRWVVDGLRARANKRAEIVTVPRMKVSPVDSVKDADCIVLVVSDPIDSRGEIRDWLDIVGKLGKPLVVVLAGARPAVSVELNEKANAVVGAWSLGLEAGNAVADVLFGDVNPGGKLPVTLARGAGQLPLFYNAKPSARRGYLFESSAPLYPFGWGLGYSTFEVGAPRLSAASIAIDGSVQVAVDVRNSGRVAGDETVQLYIRDKVSSVTRPVKELKGFRRVSLAAGEQRTVTFTLDARSLEMWDAQMRRVVEPGEFDIMAGANSTQLKSVTLVVQGAGK